MNLYEVRYIIGNKVYKQEIKAKDLYDVKQYCSMYINGYIVAIDFIEVLN